MKIIKQGTLPKDRSYTTTCDNCDTKFSFKRSEGKYTLDQRDGEWIEIKCPLCKERICVTL